MKDADEVSLQKNLDSIIALFDTLGLKANETKTKLIVFRGPVAPTAMSTDAYNPKCTRVGKTFEEKKRKSEL